MTPDQTKAASPAARRPASAGGPAPGRAGIPRALAEEVLGALEGEIEPVRVSLPYRLGLAVVAALMVLLPLVYVGLIALTAYAVYYHATEHTSILTVRGRGWGQLVVYLGPIAIGGILVAFMVKPLFAQRPKEAKPRSLDRKAEPLLFAFVARICELVGAPRPRRVDVDCQVNAFASFRRGLLSFVGSDLVLTIGLPLVAGLSMRQFAGVLAHEFGHFAQRGGMRFTYVIRSVNGWFARVVYERDAWDQWLIATSKGIDIRIGVVLYLARFFVWLTRKVLWALMMVGHVLSCFMLREMEYDADRYEARVAGSDTFESTMRRLLVLHVASQGAFVDLQEAWREKRLNDDLSALILANVEQIPAENLAKIEQSVREQKTGVFDTHPADEARVRRARAEGAEGVFRLDHPATELFADFRALGREVTFAYYRESLGAEVRPENLLATEALVEQQKAVQESYKAAVRYFQKAVPPFHPLVAGEAQVLPPENAAALAQALKEARTRIEAGLEATRAAWNRFDEADDRVIQMAQATGLLDAGFQLPLKEFKLRSGERMVVERAARDAKGRRDAARAQLDGFLADSRVRLFAALRLLHHAQVRARIQDADAGLQEASALLAAVAKLGEIQAPMAVLRDTFLTLNLLFSLVERHQGDEQLIATIQARLSQARTLLLGVRDALQGVPYPFEHAAGAISLADYACPKVPREGEPGELMDALSQAGDQLHSLHFRVLGRLALLVEPVEKLLGLEPLPLPPEPEGDDAKQ